MKYSKLFTKTLKEAPADELSKNAQLLIRAGFIYKEMAGAYVILPLGLRVLNKISDIVREEMGAIGGEELQSTALQRKEVWEKTDRWSDEVVDNWFKTGLKNGSELGLGFTHEEPMTDMMRSFIHSYKDLPAYPYDIRTVFRNEARAKSGLMRGREFFWKAMYSFSKDEAEHQEFYEKAKTAYKNVFDRVGLGDKTYLAFASGGTFSKYSHEFQTLCEAGEDTIYLSKENGIAVNKEVYNDDVLDDLKLEKSELVEEKAVEVGNIFSLGTKFSGSLGLTYNDEHGLDKEVVMGSYGIGISRLLGVIVEVHSDMRGLVWPESVAPFKYHLVTIAQSEDDESYKKSEELYNKLIERGEEVLWDDRMDVRPGEKFADADLIGCSIRIVVSPKTLGEDSVEVKLRSEEESKLVKFEEV
ncbi:MAG: prolyl-tRNA synthetase [Candidatus Nomurabacteria bacterium]|nr:MAG: prolyl-tRNA synthetase [Candidatus Nomurabacteria bacterium]HRV75792.1 His/Gly/Thr/Pro-type tRNA ligase C-terminal domain-containing protein [Candidatus Saccharimonadales bacterium]